MVLALLLSLVIDAEPPPRALQDLINEARIAATSDESNGGVSQELARCAEAINKYGAEAIPLVLPLLQHPSPGVRNFFGYVIADLPGLTPRELAPLIAAYRGGNTWVLRAISSIDSALAREFLLNEFLVKPDRFSAPSNALIRLGVPGVMALIKALRAREPVKPDFRYGACHVFREIGEPTGYATPNLLSFLRDPQLPTENRVAALTLIACSASISDATRKAVDAAVTASKPLAAEEAVWELQRLLGTPAGIARSVERLSEHPEEVRYLAAGGQAARAGEPAVLALLQHEHAAVRLEAISVLGAIGGKASVLRLEALLKDSRDWRAPCAAARSLALLKAHDRVDGIRAAEGTAWFEPTAKCMRAAVRSLESGQALEPDRFLWELPKGTRLLPAPETRRGTDELDERALRKLNVTGMVRSYGERGQLIENITRAPTAGLSIDGGVLAGTNRGEWGGELVLLSPDAGQQLLLEENVTGVHRLGGEIVVVTGLAHMSFNEGAIYRVGPSPAGSLKATEWLVLPGAPQRSFVLPNGRLFVSCTGADIVIDEGGTIALATPALLE